jgi:hypothetical protein
MTENRMVGKVVGKSVSVSASKSMTARPGKVDEGILALDYTDDAIERAAARSHNPALTLGFCTFNLLECPIGSRI